MAESTVRFNLFKINASAASLSVRDRLRAIEGDDLDERTRDMGSMLMRLESIDRKKITGGARLWYLDFVRMRDVHGPGKASMEDPIEGFEMDDQDYFGEETAALFLPDTGHLIVQSNHFGAKATGIARYLAGYDAAVACAYDVDVVVDQAAEQRFRAHAQVRKFTVGINLQKMTAADRNAGFGLGEIARIAEEMDGARLTITVSAGRERTASLTAGAMRSIRGLLGRNTVHDVVTHAVVAGRETPNDEIEAVDLIEQKLTYEISMNTGPGKRLPQAERWAALRRAYMLWRMRIENS